MPRKSLNRSLHAARATKQDEFYTQLSDIEKELGVPITLVSTGPKREEIMFR